MKVAPVTRALIVVACGIALALPLGSCVQQKTAPPPAAPDPASHKVAPDGGRSVIHLAEATEKSIGLEYAVAQERLLDFAVKTTGEVLANANLLTHVNTPVGGRVQEVLVSVGDRVAGGQTLLLIRSQDIGQAEADLLQNDAQVRADLKRDLLQIDSDMSQANAQIKLSESTYQRIKNLVEEKIASRADFEAARTQYEKDKITLDTLARKRQATVALSEERLRLLTEPIRQKLRLLGVSDVGIDRVLKTHEVNPVVPVIAPEAGVVSERLINVGELTDPSKALFTIADFHSVWLVADVYEKDIAKVQVGQPIELEVDSFPGDKFVGKLNYVADSINPDTRTLAVRAAVDNPGLKLKPKMFARMTILVGEHQVLTIPKEALQDAGSYKVVYVPEGGGNFNERKVQLGSESGNYVEVLAGVRNGEKVVTKGNFDLMSESLRESE